MELSNFQFNYYYSVGSMNYNHESTHPDLPDLISKMNEILVLGTENNLNNWTNVGITMDIDVTFTNNLNNTNISFNSRKYMNLGFSP